MSSEGLGKMLEGDSADTWARKVTQADGGTSEQSSLRRR
jgi:hypothetical protein